MDVQKDFSDFIEIPSFRSSDMGGTSITDRNRGAESLPFRDGRRFREVVPLTL